MTSVPLHTLTSTKLFVDFLLGEESIWRRFEHRNVTSDFIKLRSRHGASRKRLVALVQQGMHNVEISASQKQALDALGKDAVVVTTGQQIGLFGGPLYTLLKIASTVRLASELAAEHAHTVVPVFWLEDNDHDAAEASTTVLPEGNGLQSQTIWDGTNARQPVSRRTHTASEVAAINALLPALSGPFDADLRALLAGGHTEVPDEGSLSGVYAEGASWSDAFVRLLQPFLAAWGVLVVRGSDVIASGLHAPILDRDMSTPGALSTLVNKASEELVAAGYHAQATPGHALFFRHTEEGRQRILPEDDFASLARDQPALFSPNALARPIVQDAVLPTVAVVLGPSEIAYHAQLREVYAACGVPMPVPYNRHSATLLDTKTLRNLTKEAIEPSSLMRPWQTIERELVEELGVESVPAVEESEAAMLALFQPYAEAADAIDKSLAASVLAGQAAARNTLEALRGKLRSALKRRHTEQLHRRHLLHSIIFPADSPQERIYPVAFFVARFGIDGLRIIVERATTYPRFNHLFITSDDPPGH